MLNLKHGGHVLDTAAEGDVGPATERARGFPLHQVAPKGDADKLRRMESPFDYLLPQLKARPESRLPGDPKAVIEALNKLGAAMVDNAPAAQADGPAPDPKPEVNSTIPAVYTYWGQFVDHDLTANTDRDDNVGNLGKADPTPEPPDEVTAKLKNLRRPTLDLDSVYGDGPGVIDEESKDAGFYVGARFRIGRNSDESVVAPSPAPLPVNRVRIPPENDLDRDLPASGRSWTKG